MELDKRPAGGFALYKKINVILGYYRDMIELKKLVFNEENIAEIKTKIFNDLKVLFDYYEIEDWTVDFSVDKVHQVLKVWFIIEGNETNEYWLRFAWRLCRMAETAPRSFL